MRIKARLQAEELHRDLSLKLHQDQAETLYHICLLGYFEELKKMSRNEILELIKKNRG